MIYLGDKTAMTAPQTLAVPLETGQDGVIRIRGTRVRLDTVVYAFNEGATPEEILSQYPVLSLENVYAVIAYYLKNRMTVDAYLARHQEEAAIIREEIESKPEYKEFRQRLLARVKKQ
jgi:uncharacterized protein (DUF433 family)